MAIRYWLVVHPLDRARELVADGSIQVPWGRREPMAMFHEADGIVLYCPRERNPDGEPLRAAVQAGRILTALPYQAAESPSAPWRHRVEWLPEAQLAPIRRLRDQLDLTRDRRFWGEQLRDGFVELSHRDFIVLEDAVRRSPPEPSRFAIRATRIRDPLDPESGRP